MTDYTAREQKLLKFQKYQQYKVMERDTLNAIARRELENTLKKFLSTAAMRILSLFFLSSKFLFEKKKK